MSAGGAYNLAELVCNPPEFGWLGSLVVALCVAATLLAYTLGARWRHGQAVRSSLLVLRATAIVCLFLTLLHPACVRERQTIERPLVAVLLDDSASMSRQAQAPEGEGASESAGEDAGSRYARAVSVLRRDLLPALESSHRVRLFDVEARALPLDDLPRQPVGTRSPLTDALLHIRRDLEDDALVGIVLLSDGAEMSTRPTMGGLEQLHVPVHTIDVSGAPDGGAAATDLAIQAVSANRRVLVGNTVRVAVDMLADSHPGGAAVPLSILDGGQRIASRTIRWEPGQRIHRAELDFTPRRPGEFTYTVVLGALPAESNVANNRQTFPLTVRAQPLTVLYVDGVLRWEGKFVREALGADPDVNVVSAVRTARVGSDHRSQGLLLPEQLSNVDVVILGDVEATYFSTADELQALCTWVTDNGGGLLLTGGYHSFGPQGFGRTELRDILPVEFSAAANPQIEQPFNLKLTDAGREHPVFQLSADRLRDTTFFHKLPALGGCSRVAGVKPGAEVLAVNPQVGGPGGEQGLPVMIAQQVGAGRTMVFAVDTTWRWRLVVGGFTGDSSFYQRFWGQLVRWLASEQDEPQQRLFVSTDRSRCSVGETITLNITRRADQEDQPETTAAKVSALAMDESGRRMNIPLAELGAGQYRGTLAARQPGRLDLTVVAEPATGPASGRPAESRVVTVQVERPDLEMLDPRPDPQWLARVAQLSGGRSIQADEIQTWARQLPATPVAHTTSETTGLWGDRLFGTAFVVLLCAEWILRRRSQLA